MTITKKSQKVVRTPTEFIAAAPDGESVQRGVLRGKKRQITLTIMPDLLEKVDAMARRLGQSRAAVINMAVYRAVVAAYFIVLVAILFVLALRILFQDGLDYRKGFMVGLAFWMGIAFQLGWIFPEYYQGQWGELLGNGMTIGGFTVILLTLAVESTSARRRRLRTVLNVDSYPNRRHPARTVCPILLHRIP